MVSIEIKNLTFTYPDRKYPALSSLDLSVEKGEFLVICGKSGCGKSTLLRHLKTVLTPHGESSGEVLFGGVPLRDVNSRTQSERIGYVLQNPDNQLVTDKVWHELAFGLENLGYDGKTIRLRVAEMASFFGIEGWFDKDVNNLSGGQKQILNLASVMAMQPEVVVLDEPTSQLDPIAAREFLDTVYKINRELGTTVILTEHRLEDVFPAADRAVVMEKGSICAEGTPRQVGELLMSGKSDMMHAMPAPVRIYGGAARGGMCPLNVREGRAWLDGLFESGEIPAGTEPDEYKPGGREAFKLKDVWFRYEKNGADILRGLNFTGYYGEITAIVGGNGSGKTTTFNLVSGILKPYRGKIKVAGKTHKEYKVNELFAENLGVLPQNPQSLFVRSTVKDDLYEVLSDRKMPGADKDAAVMNAAGLTDMTEYLDVHPYDLSGGEQQRAALAKVLLLDPKIILLDEPTKGLDAHYKIKLADILFKLKKRGCAVVLVSHDIEFCARYTDRCAMFFGGTIITENSPGRFFSGNSFYTTAANRMSRHLFPHAVTNEDVIELCKP